MSDPLLSMLGDLPDFPGNTPPKNRSGAKSRPMADEELNGARGKVYRIKGEDIEMFTVGELARAISRRPVTVREWERRGWIPKSNYRTPAPKASQIPGKPAKGRRLYTRDQVEFLVKAVSSFSLAQSSHPDWHRFREHVRANWPT
jgi:Cft2 family RNA processing exonuclease